MDNNLTVTIFPQLAERRTDIFGVGDEETAIGKKIGEEEKRRDERVTWDGHTSSVEAATRAARAHITLEDQIQQIHKVLLSLHHTYVHVVVIFVVSRTFFSFVS